MPKELTPDEQREVLNELRWYGNTIAGGGPIVGYSHPNVGPKACGHWYDVTLPLLQRLGQVYEDTESEVRG